MSKIGLYVLLALGGGVTVGGATCGSGGYVLGYYYSEPEISFYDSKKDGWEGLCVEKNPRQSICAYDVNADGAVDIVLYEDGVATKVKWGEEKCLVPIKSLEQITEEPLQKQEQQSK